MDMEFRKFKKEFQDNFIEISNDYGQLFEVEVDKDELWNLYLDSFPKGTNQIFRERREYDCSCCRNFIKRFGNVVVIKDNVIRSVWDFTSSSAKFEVVRKALSKFIKAHPITDIYISKECKIGTDKNLENIGQGKTLEWEHFYLELPSKFMSNSHNSIPELKGEYRDVRNVFKRSLDEITKESVLTVLELISSNSLYKGEEWKQVLQKFLEYKKAYLKLPHELRDVYTWEQTKSVGSVIGKIRNHSIGTLLVNISEDMDLETAVRKYETIVAPSNYKRPKAIFTKKMLEDAKKTVEELGYMDSLQRRFAKLDDITVNNILFTNKDSTKKISGNIFDDMSKEVAINPKKFDRVEEISVKDFIKNVLPMASEVELLLENRLSNNMVSLIAPQVKNSKNMFKWNNSFGWAYKGNITDSLMKERVKSAGGKVDGVLRFSIQWNDLGEYDRNDLDAHCIEPNKTHIFFGDRVSVRTGGTLDVDIRNPYKDRPAVENIIWSDINRMQKGKYLFYVHGYANRGGRDGFRAEIEFEGQVYTFDYNKEVRDGESVAVAEVTLNERNEFSIVEKLPSNVSSREIWNLKTNQFIPVSVMMFSPNYWDEQQGIGHKHYFFMLKDCINDESPNGFYNEFLKQDLVKHKRVFEALGGKMHVEDSDEQLSGVGFSSTKRNSVIVKVKGQTERVLNIKF